MKGRLTYIELGAEEVPIVQASLRSDLLLEQRWQVLVYRKVLVQLVHHLLEDNQVVSEDEARQEPLRVLLVKQYYLALVNGLYCGRGPDHTCLQKTIEQLKLKLARLNHAGRAVGSASYRWILERVIQSIGKALLPWLPLVVHVIRRQLKVRIHYWKFLLLMGSTIKELNKSNKIYKYLTTNYVMAYCPR